MNRLAAAGRSECSPKFRVAGSVVNAGREVLPAGIRFYEDRGIDDTMMPPATRPASWEHVLLMVAQQSVIRAAVSDQICYIL
jgi:hypothetical protein